MMYGPSQLEPRRRVLGKHHIQDNQIRVFGLYAAQPTVSGQLFNVSDFGNRCA